jgi:transcriptional regulator with XRE-family HTH domain
MSTIGQNIKVYRERMNMTQEDLAKKLRVGTHTIEKYESGVKAPDTQTILKISTVLDIPVSELIGEQYSTNQMKISKLKK